jgi:hypothetical protein
MSLTVVAPKGKGSKGPFNPNTFTRNLEQVTKDKMLAWHDDIYDIAVYGREEHRLPDNRRDQFSDEALKPLFAGKVSVGGWAQFNPEGTVRFPDGNFEVRVTETHLKMAVWPLENQNLTVWEQLYPDWFLKIWPWDALFNHLDFQKDMSAFMLDRVPQDARGYMQFQGKRLDFTIEAWLPTRLQKDQVHYSMKKFWESQNNDLPSTFKFVSVYDAGRPSTPAGARQVSRPSTGQRPPSRGGRPPTPKPTKPTKPTGQNFMRMLAPTDPDMKVVETTRRKGH